MQDTGESRQTLSKRLVVYKTIEKVIICCGRSIKVQLNFLFFQNKATPRRLLGSSAILTNVLFRFACCAPRHQSPCAVKMVLLIKTSVERSPFAVTKQSL